MKRLSGNNLHEVEHAFRLVFREDDYNDTTPFRSSLPVRLLLHGQGGSLLNREQFVALGRAASLYGESEAYLVTLAQAVRTEWTCHREFRLVDLTNFSAYYDPPDFAVYQMIENAMFSPSARWGVMLSDSGFAIAGGSHDFIAVLQDNLSETPDEMAIEFLHFWREFRGAEAKWVASSLAHVFGPEKAQGLIRTHFPEVINE